MKKILSVLLIICLIISQTGCSSTKTETAKNSYGEDWLLNTFCYIKTFEGGQEEIINSAFRLARQYEQKLSRTIPTSQIATGEYDDETRQLVDLALSFEEETEGLFCIHLGAVSDAWDFGGTKGGPYLPSEEVIASGLEAQVLDLGAIAKGYIADQVGAYLRSQGVKSAIVSLGGNIYCVGEKESKDPWKIGIEKPFSGKGELLEQRESIGLVSAGANTSVVTSGIYERCFQAEDGVFYHHILDSATGYSCKSDLLSASIIGESSCLCDALATIALLLGSEKASGYVTSRGYDYVFVLENGDILASAGAGFDAAQ